MNWIIAARYANLELSFHLDDYSFMKAGLQPIVDSSVSGDGMDAGVRRSLIIRTLSFYLNEKCVEDIPPTCWPTFLTVANRLPGLHTVDFHFHDEKSASLMATKNGAMLADLRSTASVDSIGGQPPRRRKHRRRAGR